jgi:hypothetical protein
MLGVIPIALGIYTQSLALFIAGAVIAGMGQGISFRAGMGANTAASLKTTGITFAAVMGSLAALVLVLLIRRGQAGGG